MLLHFTIMYSLGVVCICHICMMEILYNDTLLCISFQLPVQERHIDSVGVFTVSFANFLIVKLMLQMCSFFHQRIGC